MIVKTPGQSCSSAEYAKLAQTAWHTILRCMPLRTSPVTYHYTYVKVNPANGYVCTSDGYFRGKYGLLLSISAQKRNVTLCSGPLSYRLSGAVWLD